GFIIDVNSGRPFHVVVEAGHWYKHRHFLLPIGHVRLDAGSKRLTADVVRQRAERFPGFSRGEFESLTDQDIDQMAYTTASACGDDAIDRSVSWASWTHYEYPSWWDASYDRPDRADIEARNIGGASATGAMASGGNASAAAGYDTNRDRDLVTARERDMSSHDAGRAQPGDVPGVERGGERTRVGDMAKDEAERQRAAENAAAKNRC